MDGDERIRVAITDTEIMSMIKFANSITRKTDIFFMTQSAILVGYFVAADEFERELMVLYHLYILQCQ